MMRCAVLMATDSNEQRRGAQGSEARLWIGLKRCERKKKTGERVASKLIYTQTYGSKRPGRGHLPRSPHEPLKRLAWPACLAPRRSIRYSCRDSNGGKASTWLALWPSNEKASRNYINMLQIGRVARVRGTPSSRSGCVRDGCGGVVGGVPAPKDMDGNI